ncbi:Putative_Spc97 / Spc98 family protein [Hexamita inflata]|uniref:Spc97 / Spc98 family protein n=1 Tax=Hexamita inflata TaxID=28002 RepID=A0AA86TDN2_9EUKA|nr:Putative Spc97 / Spc98 family protein [Hexamita inflata]CAI9956828.1 Putative Spc97 / Spc98 family protein [Hexamita inflata]
MSASEIMQKYAQYKAQYNRNPVDSHPQTIDVPKIPLEQQRQQILMDQVRPSVDEILKRNQIEKQEVSAPKQKPQLIQYDAEPESFQNLPSNNNPPVTTATKAQPNENLDLSDLQAKSTAFPNWYFRIQANQLQSQPPVQLKLQQLQFEDEFVVQKQLVSDVLFLLSGAKQTNYLTLQIVRYDQAVFSTVKIIMDQKISFQQQSLIVKLCQQTLQYRQNVVQIVQMFQTRDKLSQKISHTLQQILLEINDRLESFSTLLNLQQLDLELSPIQILFEQLNTLSTKLSIALNPLQILSEVRNHVFLQPFIKSVFDFYIQNFLAKFLKTGNLDNIQFAEKSMDSVQLFKYIPGQIQIFDPIGTELVQIARNQVLFLQKYGKPQMQKSAVSQFFTLTDPSEILKRKFDLKQIQQFYQYVQEVCKSSQQQALMILSEQNLQQNMNRIYNYYFLQRADFIYTFIDMAQFELQQPVATCNFTKLQNQFQYALDTTNIQRSHVQLNLSKHSFMQLLQQLNNQQLSPEKEQRAINMLRLTLPFDKPFDTFFTELRTNAFELIFRRLIRQKVVDYELQKAQKKFFELKVIDKVVNIRIKFKFVFGLMEKMQHFMKELEFKVQEGILCAINVFQEKMKEIKEVDEIGVEIDNMNKMLFRKLFLNEDETVRLMDKLFADILIFSKYICQHFNFVDDTDHGLTKLGLKQVRNEKINLFVNSLERLVEGNKTQINTLGQQFDAKMSVWRGFDGI